MGNMDVSWEIWTWRGKFGRFSGKFGRLVENLDVAWEIWTAWEIWSFSGKFGRLVENLDI